MIKFEELKPGDKVTRLIGGLHMQMEVTAIDLERNVIICGALQTDGSVFCGNWEFDRETGVEEDNDLGWGVRFGLTGSYLVGY